MLLGAAATCPIAARAQLQTPVVAFLNAQTAAGFAHLVAAFKQGLNETGFVEGQNVTIEYRWRISNSIASRPSWLTSSIVA